MEPWNIIPSIERLGTVAWKGKGTARLSLDKSQNHISTFNGKIALLTAEPSNRPSFGRVD
jgi:hypothetical protein